MPCFVLFCFQMGLTALHVAVKAGHVNMVRRLLDRKANAKPSSVWFVPCDVLTVGFRFIISFGLHEIPQGDHDHVTVIDAAVHHGNIDIVEYLLSLKLLPSPYALRSMLHSNVCDAHASAIYHRVRTLCENLEAMSTSEESDSELSASL
jgi:ankyrin repeat protein